MKKQYGFYWVILAFFLICFGTTWLGGTSLLEESKEKWLYEQGKNILEGEWFTRTEKNSWQTIFWEHIVGYIPSNPYMALIAKMPYLAKAELVVVDTVEKQEDYQAMALLQREWEFAVPKLQEKALPAEVQVILYHTHNAETYLPTDGVSKITGKNGGVVEAGERLKNCLEKNYGIKTLHNQTIHDYPEWSRSYHNSLNTVSSLLKGNAKVQAVFDIHRDAGYSKKEATTVMINGRSAAKIMIVIGANHEEWKANFAFAQDLKECADSIYPGLLKDLRLVESSRYNQQAHPHSLILEIGSDLNTQEEANYAIECFARVIAEVL